MVDFTPDRREQARPRRARAFAEAEILPHIREWDEKGEVHREVFARMAELGFLGAPIPEAYGGSGMDYVSFAILCEELERADTAFRVVQSVHVGLNSLTLLQWGDRGTAPALARPAGARREARDVRPDRAGRRARMPASLATTARRDGDSYRAQRRRRSGSAWPTSRTTSSSSPSVDRSKKHKGVTAFVLERGMAGLTTGTLHGKLGIRAGNTGLINFDNVRVPVEHRIGEEGEGFLVAMSAIDQGRFTVAAGSGRPRPGVPRCLAEVRPRAPDVRRRRSADTSSSSR